MATLYKRATPAQHRVLRAVEGAVRNAAHAHHRTDISTSFARSIAKRAAGTISAQMPELLAGALRSSDKAELAIVTDLGRGALSSSKCVERGSAQVRLSRPPLRKFWEALQKQIKPLRLAGNDALADAYIEIMKAIAAAQRVGGAK
jgi:hypothetical protein